MPNPTRMELLKLKQKIKLAKKGHKLLKQKRDALIMEFFSTMKQAKDLRQQLNEKIKDAYFSLSVAKGMHNLLEVESAAFANTKQLYASIQSKNVMGVKIPKIEANFEQSPYPFVHYSPLGTSFALEKCIENYEEVIKIVVDLAGVEIAMKRLIREIEKTKRRVNSLEHILIPQLESMAKHISLHLDEMERDSFVALKTIKKKLAAKGEWM